MSVKTSIPKVAIATFFLFLFLISVVSVAAENNPVVITKDYTSIEKFFLELNKLLRGNSFTIVGQDNHANVNPKCVSGTVMDDGDPKSCYFKVMPGTGFTQNALTSQSYCNGNSALWNIFSATSSDSWVEQFEMIDKVSFSCNSNNLFCRAQIYCMPYKYPPTDADCVASQGAGSSALTRNAVDSIMPLKNPDTNAVISTYTYCSEPCSGTPITCYRPGATGSSTCEARTYSCGYETYPNCPTTYPFKGTSGKAECESSLPRCGDGSCNNGETCSSCSTDCGSCNSQYCGDGSCNNGETSSSCPSDCGTQCPSGQTRCNDGVCRVDCNVGTVVDDPEIKATIYDVTLADSAGNAITQDKLIKGQDVTVAFKVRVKYADLKTKFKVIPSVSELAGLSCFPAVVGFICYDGSKDYLVEAGIIPYTTAVGWKLPGLQTFSIFDNLFAANNAPVDCCSVGQPNIAAIKSKVTTKSVVWKGASYAWNDFLGKPNIADSDYVDVQDTVHIKIPDETTQDNCPVNGQKSVYWAGNDSRYTIYVVVANDCRYKDGVKASYDKMIAYTKTFDIVLNANITYGLSDGESCQINAQCKSGVCKASGWFGSGELKCVGNGGGSGINGNSTIIKKYPLTKEQISKSTSGDLLSSACYGTSECADKEQYTITCIPISTLVKDGTMTNIQEGDLFSDGKSLLTSGLIGGGVGAGICITGLLTSEFTFGTSALIGCGIAALAGAGVNIGIGEAISQYEVKLSNLFTPELQQAINRGDSSKVGICTAEKGFDFKSFIESIGKQFKITGTPFTDGLIILIGGFFLVLIAMNFLGGKK